MAQVEQILTETIQHTGQQGGALLPALHAIQNALGYIPPERIGQIATALNVSSAEVDGVISFYHDFRRTPPAATTVKICRAEACQALGSRELEAYAKASLGLDTGVSCEQQQIALEAVYCLGNCACGPSVTINDQLYARVTPVKFDQLMATIKAGSEAE